LRDQLHATGSLNYQLGPADVFRLFNVAGGNNGCCDVAACRLCRPETR
jgi:hypothetical protein